MSLLSDVYYLGAGDTPPLGTPQQGSLGGHSFLLFGSLFADRGHAGEHGWSMFFLALPVSVFPVGGEGREGSFVCRISQYP